MPPWAEFRDVWFAVSCVQAVGLTEGDYNRRKIYLSVSKYWKEYLDDYLFKASLSYPVRSVAFDEILCGSLS